MAKQTNSLDSHIHDVIARAVQEAVEAVRRNILDEVSRAIGVPVATAPATRRAVAAAPRAAAPVAAPAAAASGKRTWPACTKAGCSNKFFGPSGDARLCYQHYLEAGGKHPNQAKAAPKASAAKVPAAKAPAAKAPAAKAAPVAAKGKRGGKPAASAPAVGALHGQVVDLINKHPGLRAEQISKQLGAKPEPVKAVLAALRESGKVKVSGKARGTTYSM